MTKPYNKLKIFKLHTKFDLDTIDELRKTAKLKNMKVSQLVRYLIENGLKQMENQHAS